MAIELTHSGLNETIEVPSERTAAVLEKSGWKRNKGKAGTASTQGTTTGTTSKEA